MQVWGFVVYVETHLVCQPHSVHLSSKAQKSIELFFQQFFFFFPRVFPQTSSRMYNQSGMGYYQVQPSSICYLLMQGAPVVTALSKKSSKSLVSFFLT